MPDDVTTTEDDQTTIPDEDHSNKAELERLRQALREANKFGEGRRKRLEELEAAEEQRKLEVMTETERLTAEIAKARAEVEAARAEAAEGRMRSEFVTAAALAGAAYPDDVYALADKAAVSVDANGKVIGVQEAVQALMDAGRIPLSGKRQPPPAEGLRGAPDRKLPDPSALTPAELDMAQRLGMKPERYAEQKAAMAATNTE